MSNTVYQVSSRSGVKAKKLRRDGIIPGVLYGREFKDSIPLEMTLSEANKLLKENTKSSIVKLEGLEKTVTAIVKDVQRNGATFLPEHIDFQAISLREVISVTVPLQILGEESLTHRRLLFQPNVQELILKGPAEDLPEKLEIDVSELNFEDKVHLSALSIPEGIEVEAEEDVLLGVVLSAQMAEVDEDAEEPSEDSAEPKVIGEEE
ncbi:50S ribosomal protein L25 [Proteiniclasticum ruminis]|jgi:large subunit ribosomal protein L25|uniref:50S ribosomal protein L25 n=1 Tax=Proteiniclasticum ruminis TaxID=398199 RepID=UPI0028980FCD|nr:50S ribosomal protein L25 [Proteiniclasticum ruminis]